MVARRGRKPIRPVHQDLSKRSLQGGPAKVRPTYIPISARHDKTPRATRSGKLWYEGLMGGAPIGAGGHDLPLLEAKGIGET